MSSGGAAGGEGASRGTDPMDAPSSLGPRQTLRSAEVDRTLVECVHAARCGGCPLIHLDYQAQLGSKRARVVTAASHYPALELLYTRPVVAGDPILGYRGRAKLMVSPAGAIGLFDRAGNHEVVDIPGCRVLSGALSDVATALRPLLADPPAALRALLQPFDPARGGALRAVDLREVRRRPAAPQGSAAGVPGDGAEVLLTFVLQRERAASPDELRQAGRLVRSVLPRVAGVAVNFHDADAPQILGSETLSLDGLTQAYDVIGATAHLASFGSFVQAHRGQAAQVHATLVREIGLAAGTPRGRAPRVLDLYGGSGAISLALGHAGSAVTTVESFPPASANARAAAEAQGIPLDVRNGDVAEVVAHLVASGERFDAMVVNPPRRGVSPAAREAIARVGAPVFVYVSCDPDTLARDLDHFARLGYASGELSPFDMIPLTEEVETVSVLRRAPPPLPRVLYEDDELLVVEKGPHEPVEPQAEYASSLLARTAHLPSQAGASPTAGARLLPVHALDAGTSGLCMLARTEAARAAWAGALQGTGRLVYLAAAKGVTPAKGAITRELREGPRTYAARTRYRRLAIASGHSVLRVIPDGGRTHQIRRHLAAIGHPILGDERYGHQPTNRYFEEKHGLDRTFLHLVRIEVANPRTGARLIIESTLPGDLRSTLERATGSSVLRFLEQKHALGDQRASTIPPPPSTAPPADESGRPSLRFPFPAAERGSSYPGPPSERISSLPPTLIEARDPRAPSDLRRGSEPDLEGEVERVSVPELDESPFSRRRVIISDDD